MNLTTVVKLLDAARISTEAAREAARRQDGTRVNLLMQDVDAKLVAAQAWLMASREGE